MCLALTLRNIVAWNDETESVDVESAGELAWNWWNEVDVDGDMDWLIHALKEDNTQTQD